METTYVWGKTKKKKKESWRRRRAFLSFLSPDQQGSCLIQGFHPITLAHVVPSFLPLSEIFPEIAGFPIQKISASSAQLCVLLANKKLLRWTRRGNNKDSGIAQGDDITLLREIEGGDDVIDVAVGISHVVAIKGQEEIEERTQNRTTEWNSPITSGNRFWLAVILGRRSVSGRSSG